MPDQFTPLSVRFWKRVNKTDTCWLWTGTRNPNGYGMIRARPGKTRDLTHRVSWMLHNGDIPDGLCVLHRCDNPACVRPEHLFLGTRADNVHDMVAKGRGARGANSGSARYPRLRARQGEAHGSARLTERDVRFIRDEFAANRMTKRELATMFSVAPEHVHRICRRLVWKHVP